MGAELGEHEKEELGEGAVDDGEVGEAVVDGEGGEPFEDGGSVGAGGGWRGGGAVGVERDVGGESVDELLGVHGRTSSPSSLVVGIRCFRHFVATERGRWRGPRGDSRHKFGKVVLISNFLLFEN